MLPTYWHTLRRPKAIQWATPRTTASLLHTEEESAHIHWTDDSIAVTINEVKYLAVFTDGSANLTNTEWLAHGGWGVFVANSARTNRGGHLVGLPITSYRAEVRAMVDAVLRAGTRVCIISDNAAAVNNLRAIFEVAGASRAWSKDDECGDYWYCIAQHINQLPPPSNSKLNLSH